MRPLAWMALSTLLLTVAMVPSASAEPIPLCTFNGEFLKEGPIEEASVDPSDPEDPVTLRTRPVCWW